MASMRRWTNAEKDQLRRLHLTEPGERISELLERTLPAVRSMIKALGLATPRAKGWTTRWTAAEEDALQLMYRTMTAEAIGQMLGRSAEAVKAKKKTLGLLTGRRGGASLSIGTEYWDEANQMLMRKVAMDQGRQNWQRDPEYTELVSTAREIKREVRRLGKMEAA